ncbi:MAG: hypothetical protein U0174_00940 [Polyangiaceae bacterium]
MTNKLFILTTTTLGLLLAACAGHDDEGNGPMPEVTANAPIESKNVPLSCSDFAAGIANGSIHDCTTLISGRFYMCQQGSGWVFNRIYSGGENVCWSGGLTWD